jgi:hypothetical protein
VKLYVSVNGGNYDYVTDVDRAGHIAAELYFSTNVLNSHMPLRDGHGATAYPVGTELDVRLITDDNYVETDVNDQWIVSVLEV